MSIASTQTSNKRQSCSHEARRSRGNIQVRPTKMTDTLIQILKGLVQVTLLVILVKYFGFPSLERYLDEKTVIILFKNYVGDISAPTVTVCAASKNTGIGFTDEWINTLEYPTSEIVGDLCKGLQGEEIVKCIEMKSFNLSKAVQYAGKGGLGKNNLNDSIFWSPEFSYSTSGICNQLEANVTLGTNKATDVLWIKLNSNLSNVVFIHDPNLFFFSAYPELPFNTMTVDDMKMYSFKLVQHRNMDLASQPCNSDPHYSFTGCIKNGFSKEVGCRLHWDKWTDLTLPICDQLEQYR